VVSSDDLTKWKDEGMAMPPETKDSSSDIYKDRIIERPKVLYNDATKKFVMWMHLDKPGYGYSRLGLAVSDTIQGPYKFVKSQLPFGNHSWDLGSFKDEDGKGYLIYSRVDASRMEIAALSEDFLSLAKVVGQIGNQVEAPAVLKHQGRYYVVGSGLTGWQPNPAHSFNAATLAGPWSGDVDPCVNISANNANSGDCQTTFRSQSTFILPVKSKPGAFLFMADRWFNGAGNSQYVWLPLTVGSGNPGKLSIVWRDSWDAKFWN
jgi:hypothetical protein